MYNNLDASIIWAKKYLQENNYLIGQELIISDMPWSSVVLFHTTKGMFFLKTMSEFFSKEPIVLALLSQNESNNIPKVIAINSQLLCFIMLDAGVTLRSKLKQNFSEMLLCAAIEIYADIQRSSTTDIAALLNAGINDWSVDKIPLLYEEFLANEDHLHQDGLSDTEISCLKKLTVKLKILCTKLASYAIDSTIEHGDLHDNNILIKDDVIIISDWGDARISHPFFSCVNFLESAQSQHYFNKNDNVHMAVQKAYLNKFIHYTSYEQLLEAYSIAEKIRYFIFALSFVRIKYCKGIENFPKYNGLPTVAKNLPISN